MTSSSLAFCSIFARFFFSKNKKQKQNTKILERFNLKKKKSLKNFAFDQKRKKNTFFGSNKMPQNKRTHNYKRPPIRKLKEQPKFEHIDKISTAFTKSTTCNCACGSCNFCSTDTNVFEGDNVEVTDTSIELQQNNLLCEEKEECKQQNNNTENHEHVDDASSVNSFCENNNGTLAEEDTMTETQEKEQNMPLAVSMPDLTATCEEQPKKEQECDAKEPTSPHDEEWNLVQSEVTTPKTDKAEPTVLTVPPNVTNTPKATLSPTLPSSSASFSCPDSSSTSFSPPSSLPSSVASSSTSFSLPGFSSASFLSEPSSFLASLPIVSNLFQAATSSQPSTLRSDSMVDSSSFHLENKTAHVEEKCQRQSTISTLVSPTTPPPPLPCDIREFEGGKVRITVKSSTLTMEDVIEGMKKYTNILHSAEDSSLIVYYNVEEVSLFNVMPMLKDIANLFISLRSLLESKLAMYAANIPYPKLTKAIRPFLKQYPSKIPQYIGANDEEYKKKQILKNKKRKEDTKKSLFLSFPPSFSRKKNTQRIMPVASKEQKFNFYAFDFGRQIFPNGFYTCFGKRGSGKTTFMMHASQKMPFSNTAQHVVIAGSEKVRALWSTIVHPIFVHPESIELLRKLIAEQQRRIKYCNDNGYDFPPEWEVVLWIDDCGSSHAFMHCEEIRWLASIGRNSGFTVFLMLQKLVQVHKECREGNDGMFALFTLQQDNIKAIWKENASKIKFSLFQSIYAGATRQRGVLCIDAHCENPVPEEILFHSHCDLLHEEGYKGKMQMLSSELHLKWAEDNYNGTLNTTNNNNNVQKEKEEQEEQRKPEGEDDVDEMEEEIVLNCDKEEKMKKGQFNDQPFQDDGIVCCFQRSVMKK